MSRAGEGLPYLSRLAQSCVQRGAWYLYLMPHHRPLAGIGLTSPSGDLPAVEEHHIEEFLSSQVPTPHRQLSTQRVLPGLGFTCAPGRGAGLT